MSARHAAIRRFTTSRAGKVGAATLATTALLGGMMVAIAPSSNAANSVADPRNVVADSNFANPNVGSGYQTFGSGQTFGNWTVEAGNVDLNANSLWQMPAGDPSSAQAVDLNGTVAGQINQTIPTTPGLTYYGSFELAGNPSGTAIKTGQFIAGGNILNFSFDISGHSSSDMGWEQINFSFTASASSTVLTFVSGISGSNGPVVTDLVVDPPLAPTITTNANITTNQIEPAGRPVTFAAPTATDPNTGASLPVSCLPASGSVFPVGTTTVTCSTSADGLHASSTFTVKVNPALPPTIAASPNLTVYQTTPSGTPVAYALPAVTDPNPNGFTASVSCAPAPNAVFPVGTTTVTCTATEPEGPTATSKFTVKVLKITTACEGLPLDDKGYLKAHPNYAANGAVTPCASTTYDSAAVGPLVVVPGIPLLHILPTGANVSLLHGVTSVLAQPLLVSTSANSTVAAVDVSAPGLVLEAHGIYSQASSTLSGGLCNDAVTTGSSTIASLVINGKTINVGTGPLEIKLPGVIDIFINQTVRVGNTVTQRALYIDVLSHSTYITAGQAVAGVACS